MLLELEPELNIWKDKEYEFEAIKNSTVYTKAGKS